MDSFSEEYLIPPDILQETEIVDLPDEDEYCVEHKDIVTTDNCVGSYKFPISREQSDLIYDKAGEILIPSSTEQTFKLPFVVRDSLKIMNDECVKDLKIPFQLNDMQLHALYAIGTNLYLLI